MINSFKKIVVATGGTGGHLYPALEVSNQLENQGYQIFFITDKRVRSLIKEKSTITISSGSPFKNLQ